jgi:hypothetical protein
MGSAKTDDGECSCQGAKTVLTAPTTVSATVRRALGGVELLAVLCNDATSLGSGVRARSPLLFMFSTPSANGVERTAFGVSVVDSGDNVELLFFRPSYRKQDTGVKRVYVETRRALPTRIILVRSIRTAHTPRRQLFDQTVKGHCLSECVLSGFCSNFKS